MCTLVLLRRPGHDWPLLLAANRDEMADRAWRPPARHWPDRPHLVAGLDVAAGGSWFGANDDGVAAAILNRQGSLGRQDGKRSRGELVLEALDHADAAEAAAALADLDPRSYRSFNLIIADNHGAFWLRHAGQGTGRVAVAKVPEGLSMIAEGDLNDESSPRLRRYLPLFRAAAIPRPDAADWQEWERLLADRAVSPERAPREAMNFVTDRGFGTVSSTVFALPRDPAPNQAWHWRFAAGRPDEVPFSSVNP